MTASNNFENESKEKVLLSSSVVGMLKGKFNLKILKIFCCV